jgi:hypothetical protein
MSRHKPKQKQLAVALSDEIRYRLELAAAKNGCSLAQEIRQRLRDSLLEDELDEQVKRFRTEVTGLATMISADTRQDFRTHPATNAALRHAINARLARTKESGPETFAPGQLRENRIIAPGSENPEIIGVATDAYLQAFLDRVEKNIKSIWLGTTAKAREETEDMNEDMNKDSRSRSERLAEARAELRRAVEKTRESAATLTEPNVEGEKHHDDEEQK